MLGEFDGKSAAGRAVQTGEEPLDDSFGHDLDPSELGDLEGVEQIETLAGRWRGTIHPAATYPLEAGEVNARQRDGAEPAIIL